MDWFEKSQEQRDLEIDRSHLVSLLVSLQFATYAAAEIARDIKQTESKLAVVEQKINLLSSNK